MLRLTALASVGLASFGLAACGSADEPATTSQTVDFTATEYQFGADPTTEISSGTTVRLTLTNNGTLDHEMQLLDANGRLIDRIERVAPGGSGEVVVSFEEPGVYQLICDIDDHLSRGQRSSFTVNE
jgi:uncharacterized cupredoxin-like copper-binding protein